VAWDFFAQADADLFGDTASTDPRGVVANAARPATSAAGNAASPIVGSSVGIDLPAPARASLSGAIVPAGVPLDLGSPSHGVAPSIGGATFVVNNQGDTYSTSTPGVLTLREAVYASINHKSINGSPTGTGNDVITFAPALAGDAIYMGALVANNKFPGGLSSLVIPTGETLTIVGLNSSYSMAGSTGSPGITLRTPNLPPPLRTLCRLFDIQAGATLNRRFRHDPCRSRRR
jgi:hypothetical protein